jgi:hypothetical protein
MLPSDRPFFSPVPPDATVAARRWLVTTRPGDMRAWHALRGRSAWIAACAVAVLGALAAPVQGSGNGTEVGIFCAEVGETRHRKEAATGLALQAAAPFPFNENPGGRARRVSAGAGAVGRVGSPSGGGLGECAWESGSAHDNHSGGVPRRGGGRPLLLRLQWECHSDAPPLPLPRWSPPPTPPPTP